MGKMQHIFICYSHADRTSALKLRSALEKSNRDVWIDLENLPAASAWREEIRNAITHAVAFIYLISPDSLRSEYCQKEFEFACKLNKRVFPVLLSQMTDRDIPENISSYQWLHWDDFGEEFDISKLNRDIETDYEWVKFVTGLEGKAFHWENQKDHSRLIRGRELQDAEQQLANAANKDPQPTDMLRQYILDSRRSEERQRRQLVIGLSLTLLIVVMLALSAWWQRDNALRSQATAVAESFMRATAQANAEEQAKISLARSLSAQAELLLDQEPKKLALAILLSLESYKQHPTLEGDQALRHGVAYLPELIFKTDILPGSSDQNYNSDEVNNPITVLTFSPDGHWLAIGTEGVIISVWDTVNWKEVMRVEPASQNGVVGVVRALAFSPDSQFLISGADGGFAQVWDINSGQEISRINHEDQVFIAAFTTDGTRVISGAAGKVLVWDPLTGSEFYSVEAGTRLLAVSQDGQLAATAGGKSVTVWELATGKILSTKQQISNVYDTNVIRALAFTPDHSRIASSEGDSQSGWIIPRPAKIGGRILIWNPLNGEEISVVEHGDAVPAISFSSDGKKLVTGSYDGTSRVWEAATGRPIHEFSFQSPVGNVVFGKDDSWIVSAGMDGTARIWEASTGSEINRLVPEQDTALETIAISTDGKFVAGGTEKGQVWVWKIAGQEKSQFRLGEALTISSVDYNTDGNYITTGSWDRIARVWDVETGDQVSSITHDNWVFQSIFSPDGKTIASGDVDGNVKVWDPSTGQEYFQIPKFEEKISGFVFSPDGNFLAITQGTDPKYGYALYTFEVDDKPSYISIWDTVAGREVHRLHTPSFVNSAEFSPDGRWFVFGGNDKKIHVIDTSSWKEYSKIEFGNRVNLTSIAPDSDLVAGVESCLDIAMGDSTCEPLLRVWRISTHQLVWETRLNGRWIPSLAFSPDGGMLAASSLFLKNCYQDECKNRVQVWNALDGDLISQNIYDKAFGILAIKFNKQGTLIASGGGASRGDGWVDVWNPATGESISRFAYQQALALEFSPDGGALAIAGNQDGPAFVKVYSLGIQNLVEAACSRLTRNLTDAEWAQYLGTIEYDETCANLTPPSPQPAGASDNPVISSDGQYAAFESYAGNLVCENSTSRRDVFVFDQSTSLVQKISLALDGGGANGNSAQPSLSADGRYIVFESNATNLISADSNNDCDSNYDDLPDNCADIFLFDRQSGQTTLVSVSTGNVQANNESMDPKISSDGRYVVFTSLADNLVSGDTNTYSDIFLRDLQTGETSLISKSSGIPADGDSRVPVISADNRYILFSSRATNLDGETAEPGWYLYEIQTKLLRRIPAAWQTWMGARLSADGILGVGVSITTGSGLSGEFELEEVDLYDFSRNAVKLISIAPDGEPGNRDSQSPGISADGRYVTFASESNNLTAGDTNFAWDIFLMDLQKKQLDRISLAYDEAQSTGHSLAPFISADGRFIIFTSTANNLVPNDVNGYRDIFIYNIETRKILRIEPPASCK